MPFSRSCIDQTAHGHHGMTAFFGGDERVFQCHRCFFAKKATDFPKNRFSSSRRSPTPDR